MKKTFRIIFFLSILLVLALSLVVMINFEARVSLLMTLHNAEFCRTISSTKNWLGCKVVQNFETQTAYINLYSTKFPFSKLKIELPPVSSRDVDGYYSDIGVESWSVDSDTFVIGFWKKTEEQSHNACIVKVESDSSYKVNCYPKMGNYISGSFGWSIDGKTLLYSYHLDETTFHYVVLDQNAQILNEFNVSIKDYLQDGEEIASYGGLWTGTELYLDLVFMPERNDNITYSPNRSTLVLVQTNNPELVIPLAIGEDEQFYGVVSIEPKKELILVSKQDKNESSRSLLVMDVNNGAVIQEIPLGNTMDVNTYCLQECTKTATEAIQEKYSLLIWSWEDMSLKTYPLGQLWSIVGKDEEQNGFLRLWDWYEKTQIPIVFLQK